MDKFTSSLGTDLKLSLSIFSWPKYNNHASYGVCPFKETLGTEFILSANLSQSSWVKHANDVPLGKTHLINS